MREALFAHAPAEDPTRSPRTPQAPSSPNIPCPRTLVRARVHVHPLARASRTPFMRAFYDLTARTSSGTGAF